MRRSLAFGLVFGLSASAGAAPPSEKEVAAVELGGKAPVALSLLRARQSDGGLKLRLLVSPKDGKPDPKAAKKKPVSVMLYEGGGDDDGPSDKAFRNGAIEPFTLPGGQRGVRVDFEFQVPGSKKYKQVDTFIVSLEDTPRVVLESTTHRERDRSKVCHEVEDTALVLEKDGKLFVRPASVLDSDLNDDDLPIDKTCRGKRPGPQITYKFDGETFLQIDPPPPPPKKKPGATDDDDDDE